MNILLIYRLLLHWASGKTRSALRDPDLLLQQPHGQRWLHNSLLPCLCLRPDARGSPGPILERAWLPHEAPEGGTSWAAPGSPLPQDGHPAHPFKPPPVWLPCAAGSTIPLHPTGAGRGGGSATDLLLRGRQKDDGLAYGHQRDWEWMLLSLQIWQQSWITAKLFKAPGPKSFFFFFIQALLVSSLRWPMGWKCLLQWTK